MSNEFKIDRPGVYRRRNGEHVWLWPTFSAGVRQWVVINTDFPVLCRNDGCYFFKGLASPRDVVAYVGPLPSEILRQMREALALAEERSQ
jgi:hypothetical protein